MAVGGFGSGAVELGVGFVSVVPSARGFSKELDKQLRGATAGASSAGEKVGKQMSSGMSKALKVGGAAAGAAAVAGIGVAITKGFGRLNQIDQARAKLSGLGHEAGSVEKIMDSALTAVKGTAFGMGDAATVAAATVAAGVKPGQELERTLKLMGDAATIAGTDMATMGSIVNKVATSDMMQMDVANQLMDAGIPILQMVADEMGVTAGEARKLASEGKVSFETFQNALDSGLGGAALKSGETLQGSLNNLMASVGRLGEAMLKPFMGEGKGLIASLTDLSDTLTDKVGPAMESFAGWLADTAVPALKDAGEWVQRNRDWIAPLAVSIGAVAAVWATWTGAISLWQTVTKIATGIQAAFNAVMAANPIMLVVMAVGALVAGLVYFFTKTETGQRIWESFTDAISVGWEWVKAAFASAWDFIAPVLDWISDKWAWLTTKVQEGAFYIANVLWPLIQFKLQELYNKYIEPIVTWISDKWTWLTTKIQAGVYYVTNVVWPLLQAKLRELYSKYVDPIVTWISDKWQWMKDKIGEGWHWIRDNVFEKMKSALGTVKSRFETVTDRIKSVWESISDSLKKPIAFLINTVWNEKLVPAWNRIGGPDGFLPGLPDAKPLPAFATGGAVFGPGTGTSDSIMARLSNDEHVLTAREVSALGGHGVVYALRDMIKRGVPFTFDGSGGLVGLPKNINNSAGDLAGAAPGLLIPGFAEGGAVRPAWEAQLEEAHKFAKSQHGRHYQWAGPRFVGDSFDCSGFMGSIAAAIQGTNVWQRYWATMAFPGSRPQGFQPGLAQGFSIGVWNGGPYGGHTAGTLSAAGPYGATNVESGGAPSMVKYGVGAAGADDGQFKMHYHLPIGADGAFESGGGPSPEQQREGIRGAVKDILDKALSPIQASIAEVVGTPPPEYLGIPQEGLTETKNAAVDSAFNRIEELGDQLRSVWDSARNAVGGLFRDNGGFIPDGKSIVNNETGKPEAVLNWKQLEQVTRLMETASGVAALLAWAQGDPSKVLKEGLNADTVEAVEAMGELVAGEIGKMSATFESTWRDGMLEDAGGVFGLGQVGGVAGAAMDVASDPEVVKAREAWDANQGAWLNKMVAEQVDRVEQFVNGGATYNVYANDLDEAMKRLRLREAQRSQTHLGAR